MKLLRQSIKPRVLWLLASLAALLISAPQPWLYGQKPHDEKQSVTRWINQDDDHKRSLEIRGKAEFNDDYTDVVSVTEGGFVIVEEQRGRESQRYEVRRDMGGQLTRVFYVNGAAAQMDQTAKRWVAELVLNAVRQGGIDTEKRVTRILAQRGVPGVLAEIEQIKGDWAKRRYYETLIKQADLDANALRDVLRQAGGAMSSDYEKSQLLIGIAPMLTGKEAAIQPFFDAVATISSDYEHGRVLKSVMKKETPSSAVLVLIAASSKNMSSDYERRGVLSALVKTKNQSEEVLKLLLDSAAAMSSDYEKATLLVEVSNVYTGDTRLKSAFLKVVESIKSDYERGRVLSALLKNKQIG
ncbi:MAG TPA: hypothetical protein VFR78_12970 [Pyrinomonadaceae bacterium]|nr:hypothetical protein [Pyrinomonadaceae bacterium]